MDGCPFCAIIAGTTPATVVRRWNNAMAIAPLSPVVDGHTLVIPRKHVAPPPAGAQPPTLWGDEDHVRQLLGDRVSDVTATRQTVTVTHFATPEAFRDYFKHNYGPTAAAYRGIAESPDRVAGLDRDLAALARRHNRGTDTVIMDWEYLLLTAHKRS